MGKNTLLSVFQKDIIQINPTEELLQEIKAQLDTKGFFCLKNSLNNDFLSAIQNETKSLITSRGKKVFFVN